MRTPRMSTGRQLYDRIGRAGTRQRAEAMVEVSVLIRDAEQTGQNSISLRLLEATISRALGHAYE